MIKTLSNEFPNHIIGYSGHETGLSTTSVAVAFGAKIVERHFTLDQTNETIRDHQISTTPDEFKTLINIGRHLSAATYLSYERS